MRPLYDRMQGIFDRERAARSNVMQEAYGINMNPYSRSSSTSEMYNSPNNNSTYGPGTNATRPISQESNVENLANKAYFDSIDEPTYTTTDADVFGNTETVAEPTIREMLDNEVPHQSVNSYQNPRMGGPESYTSEFTADARELANDAIMRQLGLAGAGGAVVGTTGLIANSAQQDENGNLIFNPLTGAVASTMGAGVGAYALNQQLTRMPSEQSINRWEKYQNARGTRAFDAKAQRLHNAQAARVSNRGMRAGAATAGAVGLMNLIAQLQDEQ